MPMSPVMSLTVSPPALGERHAADLQGYVRTPVVDRIDRQVERREDDERRVESRCGTMVQQPVFRPVVVQHDAADPYRPGERRRAAAGDGSCLLFLFSGHCRPRQVGVAAPVQQYAFHGDPLAVEPHPAFITVPSVRRTESSDTAGAVRIPKARFPTESFLMPIVHGSAAVVSASSFGAACVMSSRNIGIDRTRLAMPAVFARSRPWPHPGTTDPPKGACPCPPANPCSGRRPAPARSSG